MGKLVTIIDLGSSRIAAAMADIKKDGQVSLLALENISSNGITGGHITDIDKAVRDVSYAMKKIRSAAQRRAKNVFITTKGADTKLNISRGMVPLAKVPRQITRQDIKKCLDIASMINIPLDRVCIDKVVRRFFIDDGTAGVRNPVGLYGIKLEAETFIATVNHSKIQNITKCIDHAGFLLDGIYLSSICSANSVLTAEEKTRGVLLIDIGSSLAEMLVFKDNTLQDFRIAEKGPSMVLEAGMRPDFSSVVVTGGGALPDGVIEETERALKVPARIGIVGKTGYSLNSRDAIIHTSTIGLIDRMAEEYRNSQTDMNPARRTLRKIIDIYESYF